MTKQSGKPSEREFEIAKILRPLGSEPLSRAQADVAGKLLGVHWTTVYRMRKRFLADPVASSVAPKECGPRRGNRLISPTCEQIVEDVLGVWLSKKRALAHPLRDVTTEIRSRCRRAGVEPASRSTVAAFVRLLPLKRPSALANRDVVQCVLAATGGITGAVAQLLNCAAELAIRDASESISLGHLEQAAATTA
jgi:hypothetical protein